MPCMSSTVSTAAAEQPLLPFSGLPEHRNPKKRLLPNRTKPRRSIVDNAAVQVLSTVPAAPEPKQWLKEQGWPAVKAFGGKVLHEATVKMAVAGLVGLGGVAVGAAGLVAHRQYDLFGWKPKQFAPSPMPKAVLQPDSPWKTTLKRSPQRPYAKGQDKPRQTRTQAAQ